MEQGVFKSEQSEEIDLVRAMGVCRMACRPNVRSVVVKQVKDVVAFMLVGPNNLGIYRHVVCYYR